MTDRKAGSWAENMKKNTLRLAYWTLAWLLTLALATFGPQFFWDDPLIAASVLVVNVGIGFGMIWANKLHLRGLDELQQKVQLDAMGLSLGVGLVLGIAYSTMDTTDLIDFDAEITHLVIVMGLTYLATTIVSMWRYR